MNYEEIYKKAKDVNHEIAFCLKYASALIEDGKEEAAETFKCIADHLREYYHVLIDKAIHLKTTNEIEK